MAGADLSRARRIADALSDLPDVLPEYALAKTAHAYGVMAQAVAESDPAAARRLLQVAFERLEDARRVQQPADPERGPPWIVTGHIFAVAASLVESAVVVDPSRSREYFWRALAFHPGPDAPTRGPVPDQRDRERRNLAQIAILLGLYDQLPALRRRITESIFANDPSRLAASSGWFPGDVLAVMAVNAPERTVAWFQQHRKDQPPERLRILASSALLLADLLGSDGLTLVRAVNSQAFGNWEIGREP